MKRNQKVLVLFCVVCFVAMIVVALCLGGLKAAVAVCLALIIGAVVSVLLSSTLSYFFGGKQRNNLGIP